MPRPKLPPSVIPQEKLAPSKRNKPQRNISVTKPVADRFDQHRGEVSASKALAALLDAVEHQKETPASVPSPTVDLSPVSAAIHALERHIQGRRINSQEVLLGTVRDIRRMVDDMMNR